MRGRRIKTKTNKSAKIRKRSLKNKRELDRGFKESSQVRERGKNSRLCGLFNYENEIGNAVLFSNTFSFFNSGVFSLSLPNPSFLLSDRFCVSPCFLYTDYLPLSNQIYWPLPPISELYVSRLTLTFPSLVNVFTWPPLPLAPRQLKDNFIQRTLHSSRSFCWSLCHSRICRLTFGRSTFTYLSSEPYLPYFI